MAVLVISYTRVHRAQVRALVSLLRAAIPRVEGSVFWDEDFEPGEEWFAQIERAIDGANRLFVFWCAHAAASVQVKREYEYALMKQKNAVPVLLDSTPLPGELAPIHGIDLRELAAHIPPASNESGSASVGVDYRLALETSTRRLRSAHPGADLMRAKVAETVRLFDKYLS
jgi:hypothetical protein